MKLDQKTMVDDKCCAVDNEDIDNYYNEDDDGSRNSWKFLNHLL